MYSTFLTFFYNSTSSSEEPACCNLSRISFFFSPERERASETLLSYILVGQPHPEGCSKDKRGGGVDRKEERKAEERRDGNTAY